MLLVQGTAAQVAQLKRSGTALVLDGRTDLPRTHRAPRAMLIMALVILAAATGALPIEAAAVTGVGLMLASRCLRWGDASGALSPTVIMIIVASLALGVAMTETDGALYLAQVLVQLVEGLPTPLILSSLMLLMAILTNIISNNAAGVIGASVAIQVANELGSSPEPFVLAVIFGANMSYGDALRLQNQCPADVCRRLQGDGLRARRPAADAADVGGLFDRAAAALRLVSAARLLDLLEGFQSKTLDARERLLNQALGNGPISIGCHLLQVIDRLRIALYR